MQILVNGVPRQITVNGVPLLDGQAKAVAIALAELEADLDAKDGLGTAETALLKMVREVRDLVREGQ